MKVNWKWMLAVVACCGENVTQADFRFGNVPCERVEAATPVPDDFDAFWREAIAALDRLPGDTTFLRELAQKLVGRKV